MERQNAVTSEPVLDLGDLLMSGAIFHEKQSLMLCAIHSLNNLLCNEPTSGASTEPMFTKAHFDRLAEAKHKEQADFGESSFFNPHRSKLRLGDFDVVVLESAVNMAGCSWQWFNAKNCAATIDLAESSSLVGVVVNVKKAQLFGAWKSNHWYAVRRCHGLLLNLDSKLDAPELLGDDASCHAHLQTILDADGHLFLVHRGAEERAGVGRPEGTVPEPEPEPEKSPGL